MLIRQRILEAIEEYRNSDRWHDPIEGVFHASEAGEKCLRRLYFKRTVSIPFQRMEKHLLLLETGNIYHRYIQSLFPEAEIEKEIEIKGRDWRIVGRVDIFHNGTIYELKATSRLPPEPYELHKCQVEVYMRGLRKKNAVLVYIQKQKLDMLEFEIDRDDIRWQEIKTRFKKVTRALREKITPEAEFSPNCRWCLFYNHCRKMRYF